MEKSEKLNRFPQGKAIVTLINLMTICNYHLVEFRIKFTYHCNENDIILWNAIQSKLLCDLCAKMLKSETTYVRRIRWWFPNRGQTQNFSSRGKFRKRRGVRSSSPFLFRFISKKLFLTKLKSWESPTLWPPFFIM